MLRTIVVAIAVAILYGCGAMKNKYSPENLDFHGASSSSGVIIISAGAPEACTSTATFLNVYPADAQYGDTPKAGLRVDGSSHKSDFTDHHGYVHVVQLPAGTYYLAPAIANPYVKASKVSKADITVTAGEVVYLGEYWMPVACVFNPTSTVRDQEDRDLAMVQARNPSFDRAKVVKRLATFSGCAVGCQ